MLYFQGTSQKKMFVQTFLSLLLLNKFSIPVVMEEEEKKKEGVYGNERDEDGKEEEGEEEEEEREEEQKEERDGRAAYCKSDTTLLPICSG